MLMTNCPNFSKPSQEHRIHPFSGLCQGISIRSMGTKVFFTWNTGWNFKDFNILLGFFVVMPTPLFYSSVFVGLTHEIQTDTCKHLDIYPKLSRSFYTQSKLKNREVNKCKKKIIGSPQYSSFWYSAQSLSQLS